MSYTNEDIMLFLTSYQNNLLNGVILDRQISNYAIYLKSIKYYRENNIDPDPFFKKRLNIYPEDDEKILRLIDRLKRGKNLYHRQINNSTVPLKSDTTTTIYSTFSEGENYVPKFELLSNLQGAMDEYHKKMNKKQQKYENKKHSNERTWINFDGKTYVNDKTLPTTIKNTPINVQHHVKDWNDPFERKIPTSFNYSNKSEKTNDKGKDIIADRALLDNILINNPSTRNHYIKNDFWNGEYFDERMNVNSSRMTYREPFKR
jgi:hypothetical protein